MKLRRQLLKRPVAILAGCVLCLFLVMAVAPTVFTDLSPRSQDLRARFLPPWWLDGGSEAHLFGTDHLGRDVLARVVHGARTSIAIAFLVFLGAGFIGLVVGVAAGYYRGWVDDVTTFWINVQLSLPQLLLIIALLYFVEAGLGTVIVVLIATTWVLYARVVRGVVLSLREMEYVQASRALGSRSGRLIVKQLIPNLLGPMLVIGTLQMADVVIVEATLSFLGLGVPPPAPTWGGILADGRRYMVHAPWLTTIPGLALMLLILSINLLGDLLRDVIDPKLRK